MRKWLDSDGTHLDVRGLPAPQPMIEILRLLEAAGAGEVVVARNSTISSEPMLTG